VRLRAAHARRGLSTLEVLVTVALLAVVAAKVVLVSSSASTASNDDLANIVAEDQARQTLDRIAYSVMGADRENIDPSAQAPAFSSQIRYRLSLGVENGKVVWDDPEEILLDGADGKLRWIENPGTAGARSVVWCDAVRQLLEGELQNGKDDNGNGLIDESGLVFEIEGNAITITLTLERAGKGGKTNPSTVSTTVTCRQAPPAN
jgi:hypothetical protein